MFFIILKSGDFVPFEKEAEAKGRAMTDYKRLLWCVVEARENGTIGREWRTNLGRTMLHCCYRSFRYLSSYSKTLKGVNFYNEEADEQNQGSQGVQAYCVQN